MLNINIYLITEGFHVFFFHLSQKYKFTSLMWNRRVYPYLRLVLGEMYLIRSLCISIAAEWIVLSIDIIYYTELLH